MSVLRIITNSTRRCLRIPMTLNKNIKITRLLSATPQKQIENEPDDWRSIFKFPYIEGVAAANRLKIYQAAFSVAAVPASFLVPAELEFSTFVVAYVGITGFLTLSAASFAMRNTVGFIYTSQQRPDLVKLSSVDFWGKREDFVVNIQDVMAFSEMPANILNSYVTFLRFFNGNKNLKLVYKHGGILNMKEFIKVFGEER